MLYLCYLCQFKPLRDHLRGFLIAAWAGDKIAEFSFPEISFHFPLRPWFFFVSPAYVGKRIASPVAFASAADHPRVCGEKIALSELPDEFPGSPPRMRGKAKEEPYRPCHPGITPACAGKRRGSCRRMHRIWDHPRMCGEKASEYTCPLISLGSPPHVRGKACATSRRACAAGITPACAGKSG